MFPLGTDAVDVKEAEISHLNRNSVILNYQRENISINS